MKTGILLVDKPSGPTSHDVVSWARRRFHIRRIGHTGTLDPLASGLLILLIGRENTKKQEQFLKLDKQYEVTLRFGAESDTYDAEGTIVANAGVDPLSKDQLESALRSFVGEQQQAVPPFSAVKVKGQALYKRARAGKTIAETPVRTIVIQQLELLEFDWPNATLSVACSSGTYVRSLVHDLGKTLGVGAYVTALRRTAIGEYSLADATLCPVIFPKPPRATETNRGDRVRQ